jgi:mRNA interferase HigB
LIALKVLEGLPEPIRRYPGLFSRRCPHIPGLAVAPQDRPRRTRAWNRQGLRMSRIGTRFEHVRIIALSTLRAFWEGSPGHPEAREPVLAWYRHALKADWASPADVKRDFRSASILRDGRVVLNIAGNKYRLVVWVNYPYRVVYVRFIGTHTQYDAIDAHTI